MTFLHMADMSTSSFSCIDPNVSLVVLIEKYIYIFSRHHKRMLKISNVCIVGVRHPEVYLCK